MRKASLFVDQSSCKARCALGSAVLHRERVGCSFSRSVARHVSSVFLLLATTIFLHAEPNQHSMRSYGKLPLAFEENRGPRQPA